ncbi:MAG: ribonuclease HII [Actinomycetales bacterium]|nr:ribonuclease HII [Actinomycetales bacterium]
MTRAAADLVVEQGLVSAAEFVIGVDEVGRGALAGPVCVGAVAIRPHQCAAPPAGLTDSKLLSAAARESLVPQIHDWADAVSVGFASAAEVDAVGVTGALRRAAERALSDLPSALVLLDGSHNWLTRPDEVWQLPLEPVRPDPCPGHNLDVAAAGTVVTRVKADTSCASVAAASVLAKVARDAHMVALSDMHSPYEWAANKGYAAAAHRAAIVAHGPSVEHRLSWSLLPPASG